VILEFMVYSLVVSLLLAMAAWLAEKAFGWFGVPRRAAWVAGIALALAWPPLAMMAAGPAEKSVLAPAAVGESPPETVMNRIADVAQVSGGRVGTWTLDEVAALVWLLATSATLAYYFTSSWRLAARARTWRKTCIESRDVTVAPDIGPAAFGWRRPRVIFPSWLMSAPPTVQRMALAHETQHLAARDPQVLAALSVLAALLPWNPALFWMLRRLRFAMEVDCDARVLRGGAEARDYGMALLYVSERQIGASAAAIALIERTSQLERRIDIMFSSPRKLSALAVGICVAIAGSCIVAAGSLDAPRAGNALYLLKPPPGKDSPGWKLGQRFEVHLKERYPELLAGSFEGTPVVVILLDKDWNVVESVKTMKSEPIHELRMTEDVFGMIGVPRDAVAYLGEMGMQVHADPDKVVLMVYTERKEPGSRFVSSHFPDARALDRALFKRHFARGVPAGQKPWLLLDRAGNVLRSGLESGNPDRWNEAMEARFPGIHAREVTVTPVTNEKGEPVRDAGGKELQLHSIWLTPDSPLPVL
jgi:hypothetical protein